MILTSSHNNIKLLPTRGMGTRTRPRSYTLYYMFDIDFLFKRTSEFIQIYYNIIYYIKTDSAVVVIIFSYICITVSSSERHSGQWRYSCVQEQRVYVGTTVLYTCTDGTANCLIRKIISSSQNITHTIYIYLYIRVLDLDYNI